MDNESENKPARKVTPWEAMMVQVGKEQDRQADMRVAFALQVKARLEAA